MSLVSGLSGYFSCVCPVRPLDIVLVMGYYQRTSRGGGTVDAAVSKTVEGNLMRVRFPPSALLALWSGLKTSRLFLFSLAFFRITVRCTSKNRSLRREKQQEATTSP